ncbi:LysR family transcriptional regulator [Nonomuraea aridisoli]|uniref:LysR family transcriptional regulator n=1 Tax=Nonomuraea aridisoli TaxID=2070368 RepID=A0A2W2E4L3_9ACTN|nr:LysR substrate-binding domain-containing protein [Nonomuraea aridisoli]PZG17231.1 LysR family transcriptional regulator [Nonomuraea aridisoli]
MELRQLSYFVAVAEELHFGKAAARLGVAQPAVSQQVARLERELGVGLLTRTSRRVALTSEGVRLLAEARAALAAADRVRDLAAELAQGRTGMLRIGTSPGLGDRLPRGLAALRARAPGVDLILVDGTGPAHGAAVASGELDAAVVRGDVDAGRVRATPLGEDSCSVVLPANHPAADGDAVRIEQLADLLLRLPSRGMDRSLHDAVLARCAEADVLVRRGREVTSIEDAALEIGASAGAWTVLPTPLVEAAACGHTFGASTVAVRPLDPPLRLLVRLLVSAEKPPACAQALADAFR